MLSPFQLTGNTMPRIPSAKGCRHPPMDGLFPELSKWDTSYVSLSLFARDRFKWVKTLSHYALCIDEVGRSPYNRLFRSSFLL